MNAIDKEGLNSLSTTRGEPKPAITAKTSKEKENPVKEAPDEGKEDPISHYGRKSTVKSINKELKRNVGQEKPQKVTEKEEKLISQSNKNRFSQIRGKNGAKFASNDLSKEPAEDEQESFEAEKEKFIKDEIQSIFEKMLPDFFMAFAASEKEESIDKEIQSILEKVDRDILKVFEASEKEESTEREKKSIPEEKPADGLAKAEKEKEAIVEKAFIRVLADIPKISAALRGKGFPEEKLLATVEKMQAYYSKIVSEALEKEGCTRKEKQAFFENYIASFREEFSKALERQELTEEEKQAMLTHVYANLRSMDTLGTLAESSNNSTIPNLNKEKVKPVWTPKRKHKSKKKRW